MTTGSGDRRLASWKLIARHFGKSERTVRRWEAEEGLPVHRHMHRAQGSVFAWESELVAWHTARTIGSGSVSQSAASTATASLVVMPFRYLGNDRQDAYLAVGFTDELISDLSRLDDLRVISRTSAHALGERALSAPEIGKLLKVETLIEGSVFRSGDQLKVSLQMIDCAKDRAIWSHTLTCDLNGIFEAQGALAREVTQALRRPAPHLGFAGRGRDRRAWETLVRARIEALRWTPAAIRNAIGLLEDHADRFGENAELVAALGRYNLFLREIGADMGAAPLAAAERCLARLRDEAPEEAAKLHLAGWIAYQRGDMAGAILALQRANDQGGDDPDTLALLSYGYLLSGLEERADPLVTRLISIDPLTPLNHSLAACRELFAGRFAEAAATYEHMCSLDPSSGVGHLFHTMALAMAGDRAGVLAKIGSSPAAPAPVERLMRAFGEAVQGQPVKPAPDIDDLIMASTVDMFPRLLAQAHGLSGNGPEALRYLSVAVSRGFRNARFIAEIDPSFSVLRGTPAFGRLITDVQREQGELFSQLAVKASRHQ